ncbi:MAG: flagellar biosynthetic protein FliO [Betaproteobacteria bacterium]
MATWSAEAPVGTLPASNTFGTLLQVVFGLAVVMGAIALTAWLARRYMPAMRGVGGLVKIVGGVMVGPKERVVVVEVGDTWLVLGVTAQQVNTLHMVPRPAKGTVSAVDGGQSGQFPAWLARALNKPPR